MINVKGLCYSAPIVGCKMSNWRSKHHKDPYRAQFEKRSDSDKTNEPVFRDVLKDVHERGKWKNG